MDRRSAANIQGEKGISRPHAPHQRALCRILVTGLPIPGAGVASRVGQEPRRAPRSLGPGENPPVQHAVPGQQHLLGLRAAAALVAQRALPGREDEGVGRR